MMLEDGHERVMLLTKNLFQFFSKTNIVKPDQIKNVSIIFILNNFIWLYTSDTDPLKPSAEF